MRLMALILVAGLLLLLGVSAISASLRASRPRSATGPSTGTPAGLVNQAQGQLAHSEAQGQQQLQYGLDQTGRQP